MTDTRVCRGCGRPFGTCTWPFKPCNASAVKVAEWEDALGRHQHEHLCTGHIDDLQQGQTVAHVRAQAKSMGLRADVKDVFAPQSVALRDHQATCASCAGVRDWIMAELAAGRMFGTEDVLRAGQYTVDHACKAGLVLFEAAGAVYAEGGVAGLEARLRGEGRIA